MASAWIFQKAEDVRDQGEEQAPYYVGWYEPDGHRRKKNCGTGFHGKKNAASPSSVNARNNARPTRFDALSRRRTRRKRTWSARSGESGSRSKSLQDRHKPAQVLDRSIQLIALD